MFRLNSCEEIEEAARRLSELLEARGEWFVREGAGGVGLRRGEWEVRAAAGGLFFSYRGEAGARVWRVSAWEACGRGLRLEAVRRMGAERARLELVPRASVAEGAVVGAAARQAACARLAALAAACAAGSRIEGARLSEGARRGEPGRYARVRLRRGRALLAVTGPVAPLGVEEADAFLVSALLWFMRAGGKQRADGAKVLWLVVPGKLSAAVGERVALLRAGLREVISVFEFDEEAGSLTKVRAPSLSELLARPAPRLPRPAPADVSELAARVVALAPDAIDVARARRGETLRFRGLPFARVRRVLGREQLWFGVGPSKERRLLDASNRAGLSKLVSELAEHRRAGAEDRAHALYRAAPEAWLESLLRRDITRLDPGLRLAPLHAQLRTSPASGGARPVDLLALRRDGRLVVVELKVSEDAAHALQGADYWRRICAHHRAGHVRRARLFGDAEISDDPPLVYLVAPLLRFHRAFPTLARCLAPEIEIYRFDLNEDWRAGVRVTRRGELSR
jgi:hypothetical protein